MSVTLKQKLAIADEKLLLSQSHLLFVLPAERLKTYRFLMLWMLSLSVSARNIPI